jgi:hypothetical protein
LKASETRYSHVLVIDHFCRTFFSEEFGNFFPPIFGFQAARTEPQQLLGETQQLLGDERPILQVCNLFGIAGDIPSHEDTGILVQ